MASLARTRARWSTLEGPQLVTFEVNGNLYGLDIRTVKEINPTVVITRVPRTSRHIRGLVNIRGEVVLVLDVAVILGGAPQDVGETSQVVILKTAEEVRRVRGLEQEIDPRPFGDKPVGFLVDRIGDVINLAGGQLESTPPHVAAAQARCYHGVAQLGGALLVMLDPCEMLARHSGDE